MSVLSGYLTSYQAKVWNLFRKGLSQVEIAEKLNISRQAVHKTLNKANGRVVKALMDTAKISKVDITKIDPIRGILIGYSPGFRSRVFLTYNAKNGVQLWYEHQGQCDGCQRREECTRKLLETAREWEITITEDEARLPPTLLAEKLFSGAAETE